TAFSEKFLDRLVNRHPIDSGPNSLQRERLTGFYCFPKLTLAFAHASAQHRPGHVAEISGLRVAWKNIEDNQRIGVKRTVAPLMRSARLNATGDSRTCRNAARAQDRRINFGAEDFGSQCFAVPAQSFSDAWLGRFQNFDRAPESFFRDSQRFAAHFHFLLRFRLALRPEKAVCRADTDLVRGEFLRVTQRKICRDNY